MRSSNFIHVNLCAPIAGDGRVYRDVLEMERPSPRCRGQRIKDQGYPGDLSFRHRRHDAISSSPRREGPPCAGFRTVRGGQPVERGPIAYPLRRHIRRPPQATREKASRIFRTECLSWRWAGWQQIFF